MLAISLVKAQHSDPLKPHKVFLCWEDSGKSLFVYILALIGILKNENGTPEDEENFEEAIKNVNTALNITQVLKKLLKS